MFRGIFVSAVALIAFSTVQAMASPKAKWSYSGAKGPQNWSTVDPAYALCGSGKNQSPINLTRFIPSDMKPIAFDYKTGGRQILNNGHTIQVNFESGSSIAVDGQSFELKQLHFHAPSENVIEGKSYALEGHLVHADKNGNLAVVAIMYQVGENNAEIGKAWADMPREAGQNKTLSNPIAASALLPKKPGHYRFNGSLTTPPCTEGVRWLVMKNERTISAAQLEKFTKTLKGANNRPLQAVNARVILK